MLVCSKLPPSLQVQAALSLLRAGLSLLVVSDASFVLLAVVSASFAQGWAIGLGGSQSFATFLTVVVFPVSEEIFFRSAVLFAVGSEHLTFGWRIVLSTVWFVSAHNFQVSDLVIIETRC